MQAEPVSDPITELEAKRQRLRRDARELLGISVRQQGSSPPPFRSALKETGAGWYPLVALGTLALVDRFQSVALQTLGPEISRELGMSRAAVANLVALKFLAVFAAALLMAALVQNRPWRHRVAVGAAFLWALATLLTGFVTGLIGLAAVLLIDGMSTGSVESLHKPLVMDSYPPEVRVRAVSFHEGANILTGILGPLFVAVLAGSLGFSWRRVFVTMGVASLAGAFLAIRLKDPGYGRRDTGRIRTMVRRQTAPGPISELQEKTRLGFFEIVRRVLSVPTLRRVLLAVIVLGVMLVPFNTFFFFYLDERWGMGPGARGVMQAYLHGIQIAALLLSAKRLEKMFGQNSARLLETAGWLLFVAILFVVGGALSPWFTVMVGCFTLFSGLAGLLTPVFAISILSLVPAGMRPHASALIGTYLAVGGIAGSLLLAGVDTRFGAAGAIIAVAIPGALGGLVARRAAETIDSDLDRMVDEIVEEEELNQLRAGGATIPLLACRDIDFSYGQVQVLFGVSLTVAEGQMVGLLGTNGAGKSTLLRVISGMCLPTRGSMRFEGADITFLDAERRLRLGIVHIPTRGVFEPLSTIENLKLFGYAYGRDKRTIDNGIERAFDTFPALAARRNHPARTLSGGEQQMLALSKALILRPRVLAIDELSLGLAPTLVESVSTMVKRINQAGTAVILVDQSANLLLSLVDRAYFIDEGEVRFEGAGDDLLKRDDLLQAVFLGAGR